MRPDETVDRPDPRSQRNERTASGKNDLTIDLPTLGPDQLPPLSNAVPVDPASLGPHDEERGRLSPDDATLANFAHALTRAGTNEPGVWNDSPPGDFSTDSQPSEETQEFDLQSGSSFKSARKRAVPFQRLGRFAIQRVLGEGAFGTVYLAHDPQLERPVALKVAKSGMFASDSDRVRFIREARAAAQLRHPHIVPVYEFGQIDGVIYIAFQYVPGTSLKRLLRKEEKLPVTQAVEILTKLADALHYAHEHGIIHRDIKPDNVLVDMRGEPHITDFGCARRDEGEIRHTMEGAIMGTPAYMSPEQASGHSNEADGRSDVWSLGVMLEEMLTGVLPFEGSFTEVLAQIREREAPALRQVNASLPKDLETICAKCLAKNREQRFQTAGDLRDELERFQRGDPILSRPIGVLGRTWRWAKKNRAVASLLLAVFLTLLSGATISTLLFFRGEHEAWLRTETQVRSLRTASAPSVGALLSGLTSIRQEVLPHIEQQLGEDLSARERARLRVAKLAIADNAQPSEKLVDAVLQDLLHADSGEFAVMADALRPHLGGRRDHLWQITTDASQPKAVRFRAACALAICDPDAARWSEVAEDVVGQLVTENRVTIADWADALQAVRDHLQSALRREFADNANRDNRTTAAAVLGHMYRDAVPVLVELALVAEPPQLAELLRQLSGKRAAAVELLAPVSIAGDTLGSEAGSGPQAADARAAARPYQAGQVANAEIALLALGSPERLWRRLRTSDDPTIRAWIIDRLGAVGVDPAVLKQRIMSISDNGSPHELAGLLLALAQFDPGRLYISERTALQPELTRIYREHSHPAVHSACEWLLRQWSFADVLAETSKSLEQESAGSDVDRRAGGPRWIQTTTGHTLVVLDAVEACQLGSEPGTSNAFDTLAIHQRQLPRRFAIATKEVTVEQFQRFEADHARKLNEKLAAAEAAGDTKAVEQLTQSRDEYELRRLNRQTPANLQQPIADITWYEAAAYCYWLSEQEGLSEDEQCYPPVERIEELFAKFQPLLIDPKRLERPGYRLPTIGEWEYACRGEVMTLRPFGDVRLAARYAWTAENARDTTWPVGLLKPNDLGFFDMIGNTIEWCHDWKLDLPPPNSAGVVVDGTDDRRGVQRELRGGSYREFASEVHAATRGELRPEQGDPTVGFRVVRTLP